MSHRIPNDFSERPRLAEHPGSTDKQPVNKLYPKPYFRNIGADSLEYAVYHTKQILTLYSISIFIHHFIL